jgi:hypothetical protein
MRAICPLWANSGHVPRRFASVGPNRPMTLALHRLSASTASLHVAPLFPRVAQSYANPSIRAMAGPGRLVEPDVRFGSKADMCGATDDVRFTPESDCESEIPQKAMSALPPCSAMSNVCFGPKADMILGTSTGGVLYVQTAATENG